VIERTSLAGSRVAVQTAGDESAATGSTEDITSNVGTLGVTIHNDVCARALGVVVGDLRDTVAGTLSNLGTVVRALGNVELDVHVVARLALCGELGAGCVKERGGTSIMVRSVVATSHEDGYIDTRCVELGGSLRGGESSEGANGDCVADEGHDYGIKVV
jgi:hypothetical protein